MPFNVQAIGNDIVVTFVLHEEGKPLETDGPGLGYVDIFSSDGRLLHRLEHGDWLNAPWGVALAPLDFGVYSHDLLIGQFAGGGTSMAAEPSPPTISPPVSSSDWCRTQPENRSPSMASGPSAPATAPSAGSYDPAGSPASELYFTAGPNHGTGGLFGYLKPVSTELTVGNDQ